MTAQRGFFAEVLHRRVLQYLGLYIAGVWVGIEIGDWLTDQFALPVRLTAYIFIALAVMLPSVGLLAWRFGAPGKDQARPMDKVLVPLNVAAAVAAVAYLGVNHGQRPSVETAQMQPPVAAAVAAQTRVKRVLSFFWANQTADWPDRIGYALPILIAEDMDRASAAYSVITPFSSETMLERLRQAGFERVLDAPLSVQLREAELRQIQYLLRGEVTDAADGDLLIRYELRDVATGEVALTRELTSSETDLLATADAISDAVQSVVFASFAQPPIVKDLPMQESMSGSVQAINHYIDGRIALEIDKDNASAQTALQAAVAQDPMFAEAHARLGVMHYLNGNSQDALTSITAALKYDFRLSQETKFRLRIARAAMGNDLEEAVAIARTWSIADPDNEQAFMELARLNMVLSLNLDEALQSLERVRAINPGATRTYAQSAMIEQQRGNLEAAERFIQRLIAEQPNDASALINLARIRLAALDFDGAREAYRQAQFLDDKSLEPALGEVRVMMRQGEFAQAEDQLEQLSQLPITDQQRLEVTTVQTELYSLTGQYRQAVELMQTHAEVARKQMGALMYSIGYAPMQATLKVYAGHDVGGVIGELDAQRDALQPPWTHYLHSYDARVFSVVDARAEFQASLREFEKFVAVNSANEALTMVMHSLRAQQMLYLDNSAAAIENARKALALTEASVMNVVASNNVFQLRVGMYNLLRKAGKPTDAIAGLLDVVASFPGYAAAHLRLAQAYFAVGDFVAAQTSLDKAIDIWSNADATFVFLQDVAALQQQLAERV